MYILYVHICLVGDDLVMTLGGIEISSTLLPFHILFCSIVGYELNKNFDNLIIFELTFWIIFIVYSDQLGAPQW